MINCSLSTVSFPPDIFPPRISLIGLNIGFGKCLSLYFPILSKTFKLFNLLTISKLGNMGETQLVFPGSVYNTLDLRKMLVAIYHSIIVLMFFFVYLEDTHTNQLMKIYLSKLIFTAQIHLS